MKFAYASYHFSPCRRVIACRFHSPRLYGTAGMHSLCSTPGTMMHCSQQPGAITPQHCAHAYSLGRCLTRQYRQLSPLQGLDKPSPLSCSCCRSYGRAGFGSELIILDNTINSTLADDPVVAELAAEVMPTRTRLTFSQAQNFMAGV